MSTAFTPRRILRLAAWLALITTATVMITEHYTTERTTPSQIPEFTASCIRMRSLVVDENITDVNCSLEDGVHQIFFSLSEPMRQQMEKDFPVRKLILQCGSTQPVVSMIRRSQDVTDQEVDSFIASRDFCNSSGIDGADHTRLIYTTEMNVPVTIIEFLPRE